MKNLLILSLLISPLAFGQSGGSGGMQGFNQFVTQEFKEVRQEIKEVDEREIEYKERMSRALPEDAQFGKDTALSEKDQDLREEKAKIMILKSIE